MTTQPMPLEGPLFDFEATIRNLKLWIPHASPEADAALLRSALHHLEAGKRECRCHQRFDACDATCVHGSHSYTCFMKRNPPFPTVEEMMALETEFSPPTPTEPQG